MNPQNYKSAKTYKQGDEQTTQTGSGQTNTHIDGDEQEELKGGWDKQCISRWANDTH